MSNKSQSEPVTTTVNRVLTYKRNHPQDRSSYGIPGNPGLFVVQRGLFLGATTPKDDHDPAGLPLTITVDCEMVMPQAKVDKSEAAAQKAIEKAAKAAAKLETQKQKAIERQEKADKALAAAKAKVEAATKVA